MKFKPGDITNYSLYSPWERMGYLYTLCLGNTKWIEYHRDQSVYLFFDTRPNHGENYELITDIFREEE